MAFFESWRQRSAGKSRTAYEGALDASRHLEAARASVGEALKHEAYTRARLVELTPLLSEIAKLEMEEPGVAATLERAKLALEHARANRRRATTGSAREGGLALRQEIEAQAGAFAAEERLDCLTKDLARKREDLASRDAELRQRYGIERESAE